MGKKESLEDTARVLGRYYDGIEYRGFAQTIVEDLSRFSGIPVFNGLTDSDHPTQILADMMTMEECLSKPLNKCKVVYVGDTRNNMSLAWMVGSAKTGLHYIGLGPKELHPGREAIKSLKTIAEKSGAVIEFTDDPADVKNADVVYTDVWASMGEEEMMFERVRLLTPYRVNMDLFNEISGEGAVFMHCLPAFHDFETTTAKTARDEMGLDIREVDDDVFRSPFSVVSDEAENRMHTIKAVMAATL